MKDRSIPGSFRDPSGFLFIRDGVLYRQINQSYLSHYELLHSSGLYAALVDLGALIPHVEVAQKSSAAPGKVIQPDLIPFVSYPYEWCFSQLKDAALLTLEIQQQAIERGMVLKDCSAYNVQFRDGRPVFIDTVSFEKYEEGLPWVAYRQFCQHFLAPLALMALKDVRLNQLFRIYMDGIPLDLASALLPWKSRFRLSLATHIHLQAKFQAKYQDRAVRSEGRRVSKMGLLGIVDNLHSAVRRLKWEPEGTEWVDYYDEANYSKEEFSQKQGVVTKFLEKARPDTVWDLGANTGVFSRIASKFARTTVAFDVDPAAVEKNYRECGKAGDKGLLPLLLDLTNPSGAIGWANHERMALTERGPADTIMALALIHHLAISNNVPLAKLAKFFAELGSALIVEFVPKQDAQVQRLLATREDVFPDYTQDEFEKAFSKRYEIKDKQPVAQSGRTLYLMVRNNS